MARRKPANKGKVCIRWGRSNGRKVCRKFGSKSSKKR